MSMSVLLSPTVTSINPASGPGDGDTTVTLIGLGFTGPIAVWFGPTAARTITMADDTLLMAVSPPGVGTVDVTVQTPHGTSALCANGRFTYIAATSSAEIPVGAVDGLATPVAPSQWKAWHTATVVLLLLATLLAGVLDQPWLAAHHSLLGLAGWMHRVLQLPDGRLWFWFAALLVLFALITIIGIGRTGRWEAVLIDERNRMSLSRLQMVMWTVIVLSAFYTVVLWRIGAPPTKPPTAPLAVAIPAELWLAMGISITSLLGSPLILNATKAGKTPNVDQTIQSFAQLTQQGAKSTKGGHVKALPDQATDTSTQVVITQGGAVTVANKGSLMVKTSSQLANWGDLFQGEETSNASQLDLARIQMLYFTIIVVLAYVATLGLMFTGKGLPPALPALDRSMVALLFLSHAGYLTSKALPK